LLALRREASYKFFVSFGLDMNSNTLKHAAVVGLGGLGCPVALSLAHAGCPSMALIDDDEVHRSNLHRQLWHHTGDLGVAKVASAAAKLAAQFPHLKVETHRSRVDVDNVNTLTARADVIFDCTDGAETKLALSDWAAHNGRTLVYAGVVRFEGLVMRIAPRGPCLRCLFESVPTDAPTCAQAGVLGTMAGVVGALQVEAALAPASPAGESMLYVVDGRELNVRQLKVKRRANCSTCEKVSA
jgi:molybdopterin-synthase adenylyltransferase